MATNDFASIYKNTPYIYQQLQQGLQNSWAPLAAPQQPAEGQPLSYQQISAARCGPNGEFDTNLQRCVPKGTLAQRATNIAQNDYQQYMEEKLRNAPAQNLAAYYQNQQQTQSPQGSFQMGIGGNLAGDQGSFGMGGDGKTLFTPSQIATCIQNKGQVKWDANTQKQYCDFSKNYPLGGECQPGEKKNALGQCVPDWTPKISTPIENTNWCRDTYGWGVWDAIEGQCTSDPNYKQGDYKGSEQGCTARGGKWISTGGDRGYCIGGELTGQSPTWDQTLGQFGGMPTIDQSLLNVPGAQGNVPYIQPGAYTNYLQQMLNTPAFGGQTLDELENARVQAMRQDLGESYGTMADELTKRLNAQAEGAGMFTSGARVGAIGEGLTDLNRRRLAEEATAAAEIRGQRPQLLLQERQQRADIANLWGQMDLNAQTQNLDSFLNNRLMEYDRQFKNGELNLSAFQNNINLMGLFLDWQVSNAKTDIERAQVKAQIDNIYNTMDLSQRNAFINLINMWGQMGQAFASFGK